MTAELHVLHDTNYREVVPTLRKIADQIERGDYGDVKQCAVAIFGERLEIFGVGPDAEAPTIALLFSAAQLKLALGVVNHGND